MKNSKSVKVKGYAKTSKKISKLKAKKKYFYKVRTFTFVKNPSGKMIKIYGPFTKAKKIKAKK